MINYMDKVVGGYSHPAVTPFAHDLCISTQDKFLSDASVASQTEAVFPEFFVRECMRSKSVQDQERQLILRLREVAGCSQRRPLWAALSQDRWRMQTVFHDLYMLLSGAGGIKQAASSGFWDTMLRTALKKDPTALSKLGCAGKPVRSVLMALRIMEELRFAEKTVRAGLKKDLEQSKQEQDWRNQEQERDNDSDQRDTDGDASEDEQQDQGGDSDTPTNNSGQNDNNAEEGSGDPDGSDSADAQTPDVVSASNQTVDAKQKRSDAQSADMLLKCLPNAAYACEDVTGEALAAVESLAGQLAGIMSADHSVSDVAPLLAAVEVLRGIGNTQIVNTFVNSLGRVGSIVNDALSVNVHGDGEVLDVQQDDDPSRMLAAEYANLACPEMEFTFLSRLADHALLTSERRGVGESGMGPFVILLDKSGSMTSRIDGIGTTLGSFTGAFAMQMFCTARQWQRAVVLYTFDADLLRPSIVYSPVRRQTKSVFLAGLLKIASQQCVGGTDFSQSLRTAAARLKVDAPHSTVDLDRADVVIVSDGCSELDHVSASSRESIHRLFADGTRFFGLFFASSNDPAEARKAYLTELEQHNASLFDVCVATHCDADSMRVNCGRFFAEVLKRSFYEEN